MGERCVFVAQVHKDEKHYTPDGTMISKDHLHIMYTPAVKDTKHEEFQYKLCANDLTKKTRLLKLHPGLQKHLDNAGIHATVYNKKSSTNDGKTIALSVSQLKALTKNAGVVIDKPVTIDELANILVENQKLKQRNKELELKVEDLSKVHDVQKNIEKQMEWDYTENIDGFDPFELDQELQNIQREWDMEEEHEWEWEK